MVWQTRAPLDLTDQTRNQKPNEKASRVREIHTNITEFGQLETVECLTEQLTTLVGT